MLLDTDTQSYREAEMRAPNPTGEERRKISPRIKLPGSAMEGEDGNWERTLQGMDKTWHSGKEYSFCFCNRNCERRSDEKED